MRQMLNVLWKCTLKRTVMVKSSAQIEHFYISIGNENILYFIILLLFLKHQVWVWVAEDPNM